MPQTHPHAIWLRCNRVRYFVTEPNNLIGHVGIRTPEQALEFVRFFSGARSEPYLRPDDGLVEIVAAGKSSDDSSPYQLERSVFEKHFSPARAERLSRSASESVTMFRITRTMLARSGDVREVEEIVGENGFYELVKSETIVEDGTTVGLLYMDH